MRLVRYGHRWIAPRQAQLRERSIQQRPGAIARERPVTGVGSMQTRSKAHDQQGSRNRAK